MAWKKGPLPIGTYGWGAIVRRKDNGTVLKTDTLESLPCHGKAFEFAGFCGDHAVLKFHDDEVVTPLHIAMYNDSLQLPTDEELAAMFGDKDLAK